MDYQREKQRKPLPRHITVKVQNIKHTEKMCIANKPISKKN